MNFVLSLAAFAVGVFILMYSNWMLAKRRNEAGVEEYSGFLDMVFTRGKIIGVGLLGFVLAFGGVIAFFLSFIPR
ncbi:MAG: hypothetical protein GC153_03640 [Alphaproteobacteria bacterium]|nr:hypothetical protein [Alphaproteobacteria bacterium]